MTRHPFSRRRGSRSVNVVRKVSRYILGLVLVSLALVAVKPPPAAAETQPRVCYGNPGNNEGLVCLQVDPQNRYDVRFTATLTHNHADGCGVPTLDFTNPAVGVIPTASGPETCAARDFVWRVGLRSNFDWTDTSVCLTWSISRHVVCDVIKP
jgi:hypothetical protein